jgi:hypothetical protein
MKRDLGASLSFGVRFYLGIGVPTRHRRYPDGRFRSAAGRTPELLRDLLALHRGEAEASAGSVDRFNFRCTRVTLAASGESFFVKDFPRHHFAHDVERRVGLSRVDRAWRAAYLLPRVGVLTPSPVGSVQQPDADGAVMEYLVTEWVEGTVPFFKDFATAATPEAREVRLREFVAFMALCHRRGVYLRDLVRNVLVREVEGKREFRLTDLDGIHPLRLVNTRRVLFHMRQLAYYCPLAPEEARLVRDRYLEGEGGEWAERVLEALGGQGPGSRSHLESREGGG